MGQQSMSEENSVENGVLDLLPPEEEVSEPEEVTEETDAQGEEKAEVEEPEEESTEEGSPPDSTDKGIDPQHKAMLAKAEDANRKFQEQQQRADELQRKLDAATAQPPPDPIADPEAFNQYQNTQIQSLKDEFSTELQNVKYEMARTTVMSLKPDYEEVEAVFIEEAQQNPALARMLNESANPALFAYEQGLRIKALSLDPEAQREQIRQEERAKLEAELKGQTEAKEKSDAAKEAALKPSIADAGNAGLGGEAPVGLDTIAEATGEDARSRTKR